MPETNAQRFGRQGRTLLNRRVSTPDGPGVVEAIPVFTDSALTVKLDTGERREYREDAVEVITS